MIKKAPKKTARSRAKKKPLRKANLAEPAPLPAPEPKVIGPEQKPESEETPRRFNYFDRMLRRIRKSRQSIERRIERRAMRLGIAPEPLIKGIWELLLLFPRLIRLAVKLLFDPRVPLRLRVLCGLSLAYLISPLDLIPEAIIGPAGYLDDLGLLLVTLNLLVNEVDPEVVKEHWTGNEDVLRIIRDSVSLVEWFIPKPVYESIKKYFGKKSNRNDE